MARLNYSTVAVAGLADIAEFIADAASDIQPAHAYIERLRAKCRELAALPFPVGRPRPELGDGLRSYAFGNHVIFFRCTDTAFYVIDVVEGHRDISTVFAERSHET